MKNILKYIIIFIVIIIFFVVSLTIVAAIPTKAIKQNVEKSATILSNEKEYYIKQYINRIILYDNYTDAIMINNAFSMDSGEPLYSALVVRRNYIPGVTIEILPEETGDPTRLIYETDNLKNTVNGDRIIAKQYAKYWHGYLTFLKPLLILFDYGQIRILQLVILSILTIIFIYLIYKKIGLLQAIIFLLGLITVDIQYIYRSLENTPIFILMLCSSIIFLLKYEKIKDKGIFFFIIGMLTCFIDFLTVPIITLGIPMLIYFLLEQKERKITIKETILVIIKNSILWLLGYSLTWITKFILVDVLYDKKLMQTAIKQIGHRTFDGTSEFKIDLKEMFCKNIGNGNVLVFTVFCIIRIIVNIYSEIKNKTKKVNKENKKINIVQIIPYIIISLMPIAWYMVLQEHSARHAIFTYRGLMITYIGLMLAINKALEEKEE